MNGILEFLKTPAGQGLLSAGLGVAANAGRGGTWNAIGRGGLLGLQGYQGAIDSQQQQEEAKMARDLRTMQMDKARREAATEDRIRSAAQASFISPESANAQSQGPMPDGSAVPQVAPGFDANAYVQKLYGIDPIKAISFQQSLEKDSPFVKIDPKDYTKESIGRFATTRKHEELDVVRKKDLGPAGQVIDLYSAQPGQVFTDPNKPFQIGANGMPVANTPFQQYETNKAKAGAARTNVSVNTEKSLLNEIAGGLGKGITTSQENARGALSTIGTVNRLNDALDSGKVMAGPGASFRQFGLQIGSMLGVGGKDSAEKLLNTRQAVQSLAQLELDAAQQMKGQGQITEAERSIIRRAASGDIDGMTAPELRLLGGVLDRSARTKIENYNQQVKPLMGNPNAAAIAPFLEIPMPNSRSGASQIRKFNPQTGGFE